MSLCGGRFARRVRGGTRAIAGLYEQHGQCARRSRIGLPGRDAVARRRTADRDGVSEQLSMVRCRRAESARLGLRGTSQLSVPGRQCAGDELRHGDRPADRDVLDWRVLGQLLSRPAVVRAAVALGASSAAASAATRCGTAAGRWPSGWSAAGECRGWSSGWTAAGECGGRSSGWSAAGEYGEWSSGWTAAGECRRWPSGWSAAGECRGWPSGWSAAGECRKRPSGWSAAGE